MQFETTIELGGKTATGFEVPGDVVLGLQSGKRPRVRVTIGEHVYRSTVAVYADRFMLPLNAENREAAGVAVGDTVNVTVELDTEPREVVLPTGLAEALEWAIVGAASVGVIGAIAGLVIGLRVYAPTAPFAVVELGLPATIVGGVVGLVAGVIATACRRIKRNDARSP